ncbi:hypothetical protein KQX54_016261 [Cotesia glomerata]|uniref:Uncharacterized protein n=1 Tax=Cotesia glomerata TaxID=32391 RepID=A0AAV7J212_COTGL|nr:hypothetical protein KQX54_016261 [Cotesia glomerata]
MRRNGRRVAGGGWVARECIYQPDQHFHVDPVDDIPFSLILSAPLELHHQQQQQQHEHQKISTTYPTPSLPPPLLHAYSCTPILGLTITNVQSLLLQAVTDKLRTKRSSSRASERHALQYSLDTLDAR